MKFINYLNKNFYFILFLILGLLIFHIPALKSSFDFLPTNQTKTLYDIYVLEHSYLWLNNIPSHFSFWDAPFGYPNKNVLAQSSILGGLIPFYYIFRIFIQNALGAYQALFCFLCIVNYSTFYYFIISNFKKEKLTSLASATGAFIYTFSILKYSKTFEIGIFSQFYAILFLIFLFKVKKENSRIKNHFYFLFATLFLIIQMYTHFELGFFACLIGFFALICSFVPKNMRDNTINFIKNFYPFILFYFFVFIFSTLPLIYHFVIFEKIKIYPIFLSEIFSTLALFKNISVLDSLFYFKMPFVGYSISYETNLSFGFVVSLFSIFAIVKLKENKLFWFPVLFFPILISAGMFSQNFWRIAYFLLPFTENIDKVTYSIFFALFIASILICFGINYLQKNIIKNKSVSKIILILTISLILLEQIPYNIDINSQWKNYQFSKKEFYSTLDNIQIKIPKDCEIIKLNLKIEHKKIYGEDDLSDKIKIAQKYNDILATFLTSKMSLTTVNSYFNSDNKFKENDKSFCTVDNVINLDKI